MRFFFQFMVILLPELSFGQKDASQHFIFFPDGTEITNLRTDKYYGKKTAEINGKQYYYTTHRTYSQENKKYEIDSVFYWEDDQSYYVHNEKYGRNEAFLPKKLFIGQTWKGGITEWAYKVLEFKDSIQTMNVDSTLDTYYDIIVLETYPDGGPSEYESIITWYYAKGFGEVRTVMDAEVDDIKNRKEDLVKILSNKSH